jgi:hypothetical protein
MHQLGADRGQLIHQLGARVALSGPSPVDRWARIAGHCATQLRHASRIAGRWAVCLGQSARAAGGLVLREIEQAKENPPGDMPGGRCFGAGRAATGRAVGQ